jgi:hypothetical protein
MKVFLSHSFRPEDRDLVARIDSLLSSHDVPIIKGNRLGGGALTQEVKRRIEQADGLIALMTKRERVDDPGPERWSTHPWVRDELSHGRSEDKLTIGLVEMGVEVGGAYGDHERIVLDRDNPLDALLALSETIRIWKEELGASRKIQIKPDEIGQRLRTEPGLVCRYRFVSPEGNRTNWKVSDPVPQPSGTILYVNGLRGDDHYIEVEVLRGDSMEWWSPATAQLIDVELKPRSDQP